MLVLARKPGESLMIGDDVQITVSEVRGDTVKLAISAPRHISVHRREIYDQIKRENLQASLTSLDDLARVARELKRKERATAQEAAGDARVRQAGQASEEPEAPGAQADSREGADGPPLPRHDRDRWPGPDHRGRRRSNR